MRKISILGCGWLGLPLAIELISKGNLVKGSTTRADKLKLLGLNQISAYRIELFPDTIDGDISAFLDGSEILILDIPPKTKSTDEHAFVKKLNLLLQHVGNSTIKKLLFTSSIAVYGNQRGIVTEKSALSPETTNGKQLAEAERIIGASTEFEATIVRFGGLTGGDRHPVFHLAGRKDLLDPDAKINLIHQDDCIAILNLIIDQNLWGETFNAVAPSHPSRKEYYQSKARALNLDLPEFRQHGENGKIVSSEKLSDTLNYTFLHIEP